MVPVLAMCRRGRPGEDAGDVVDVLELDDAAVADGVVAVDGHGRAGGGLH